MLPDQNPIVQAGKILEFAITVPSGQVVTMAKSILARNVDPTWFADVEALRRHLLAAGLVDDNAFWRSSLPQPPPTVRQTTRITTRAGGLGELVGEASRWLIPLAIGGLVVYFIMKNRS